MDVNPLGTYIYGKLLERKTWFKASKLGAGVKSLS